MTGELTDEEILAKAQIVCSDVMDVLKKYDDQPVVVIHTALYSILKMIEEHQDV